MKILYFKNNDGMPAIGLGTWKSKKDEVYNAVITAIKNGYRHIDCAPIYGNEVEIGKAIADCIKAGIISRNDLWITSKLWNNAHCKEAVLPALKRTLIDLQVGFLDLYLIHWPVAQKKDVLYPEKASDLLPSDFVSINETWSMMETTVDRGLVKHIGVSNFGERRLKQLLESTKIKPELLQVESHPYLQQEKMLKFCKANDIIFTAYSPLGSSGNEGILTSNNLSILLENKVIVDIANSNKATPAQILISWAISRGTSVIPKSVNKARIIENLAAKKVILTSNDLERISKLDAGVRFISGQVWVFNNGPYSLNNLWR